MTLRFCEIYNSLTGHNVKSRAHFTEVLYCYIHHSANRELDLVDSVDTERKNSHALLMGNIIIKDPECQGNRSVIHFGQDGKREHDGTIFLINNTITTPFISPVLTLSTKKARGNLINNFVCDGGRKQGGQIVAAAQASGDARRVTGTHNWFDRGFTHSDKSSLSITQNTFTQHISNPFKDPNSHNYRLRQSLQKGLPLKEIQLPHSISTPSNHKTERPLIWQYAHPAGQQKRIHEKHPTLGAYGKNN